MYIRVCACVYVCNCIYFVYVDLSSSSFPQKSAYMYTRARAVHTLLFAIVARFLFRTIERTNEREKKEKNKDEM